MFLDCHTHCHVLIQKEYFFNDFSSIQYNIIKNITDLIVMIKTDIII